MSNLASILADTAARLPERIALRLEDLQLSYAQFDEGSARAAGLLRELGVKPGDRVGLMLPNIPQFPLLLYGALRAGAVVVPMNPLLKRRETTFLLRDCGARAIFAFPGFDEAARDGADAAGATCVVVVPGEFEDRLTRVEPLPEIASVDADTTALIVYTSGTTGTPKGAELTHHNLRRNADCAAGMTALTSADVMFGALPLFTRSARLPERRHPRRRVHDARPALSAGRRARRHRPPSREPADGGADDVRDDARRPRARRPRRVVAARLRERGSAHAGRADGALRGALRCTIQEAYGLTEASPLTSFNHRSRTARPARSARRSEGVEMRIADGEILVRGHNVMKGFWRAPDATALALRDGWLYTGDLGYVDDDGYFFLVDRKKDLIIRGGLNVYPREVEEVLYEHPAVREAAVVAVPHATLGENVGAAVVLADGAETSEADLRAFMREEIAAYKYPRLDLVRSTSCPGADRQDPQARDRGARGMSDAPRTPGPFPQEFLDD